MPTIIACVSTGKGTWPHVKQLIEKETWEKIILITNEFGKENFKTNKAVEFVIINPSKFLPELVEDIKKALVGKIKATETELGLNLISGTGKEHMAVLSALLKLGFGVRLIALTKDGVKEV